MRSFERVRASLGAWRELGVSERVLSWIAHGVPSEFVGGTPPPPFNYGNSISDPREFSQWVKISLVSQIWWFGVSTPVSGALIAPHLPRLYGWKAW